MTTITDTRVKQFTYYDFAKIFSYNGTMNHVVGGRGIGKTYGMQKKVIKDAIRSIGTVSQKFEAKDGTIKEEFIDTVNDQFIYLRRYKEELALAKATFFSAVHKEFPDWDFRVNGWEAQMCHVETRGMKPRPWITIGYFVALSVAQKFKSVAFPKVKTIIFDEYILESGMVHYLPNEATIFLNFYSTVDRYKDKTRVFFLANSVSITNPYFLEYNINPDQADENGFLRLHKGFMIFHFPDLDKFVSEVYETAFGRFIYGTEYADYAVGNQFSDNNKELIGMKGPRATYRFTLETRIGVFSVWYSPRRQEYFCQMKRPKDEIFVTLDPARMTEDKVLLNTNDKTIALLKTAYRHARVVFDYPATRNAFIDIFKQQ